MRKVLQIDGGLGRVLCATPALRFLHEESGEKPDIITSWPEAFIGNPHVRKVYRLDHDWLFEDVISQGDFSHPEPYHLPRYYRQQVHLSQAFDLIINGKERLAYPEIHLLPSEVKWARGIMEEIRQKAGKTVAAFQPFGAGFNPEIGDDTHRSLDLSRALEIANRVDVMLLNCTAVDLDHPNVWWRPFTTRELIAIVSECDFVVGVDSSVAHIGAAFGKTGLMLLGGTYLQNVGWPCYLNAYRDGYPKSYFANRFGGFLNENQGAMEFDEEEMERIVRAINERQFVSHPEETKTGGLTHGGNGFDSVDCRISSGDTPDDGGVPACKTHERCDRGAETGQQEPC